MWLVTTQGFYSAVAHRDDPDKVLVRGRTRGDIEALREQIPSIEPFEDESPTTATARSSRGPNGSAAVSARRRDDRLRQLQERRRRASGPRARPHLPPRLGGAPRSRGRRSRLRPLPSGRTSYMEEGASPGLRFVASDFYGYLRPSRCGLRVWLREQGVEEEPPERLRRDADATSASSTRRATSSGSPNHIDIGKLPREEQREATIEELEARRPRHLPGPPARRRPRSPAARSRSSATPTSCSPPAAATRSATRS